MNYRCKVCGYDQMPYPPNNYNICPCCGIEYSVDDAFESYEALRDEWLLAGAPWFSEVKPYVRPDNWDAFNQLDLAGYSYSVPRPESTIKTDRVSARVPQGLRLLNELRRRPEWAEA